MGKETKEMLKSINENLLVLMKHLNIETKAHKDHKIEQKSESKKSDLKNPISKKAKKKK